MDVPVAVTMVETTRLFAEQREAAEDYLKKVERRLTEQGVKVRRLRGEGPAAETLLDAAKQQGATLIAMTTHGYKGIARWVLGSVAERTIRIAPCPVLTVKADAEKSE